jgi:hypothetical protein
MVNTTKRILPLLWPKGADFAPEFLHDNVKVTA